MKILKITGFLALFLVCFIPLKGQNVQLILDPINPFQKTSLFSLSILNISNFNGDVNLKATLKSRRGKTLMVQNLKQKISPNEIKSVRGSDTEVSTTYTDNDFNQLYSESEKLPPLNYILCIELSAIGDSKISTIECIDYLASDFINISAINPPNENVIYSSRPLFNWLNISQNTACGYNYKLVQLNEGQNPNVALRRNNPIVFKDNLKENSLHYPSDAKPLENGKRYSWQLTYKCNGEIVSKSDAFTFQYKESEDYIEFPKNLSYVDITELENGASLFAVGEFKFKYPSDTRTNLKVELYEIKNDKKKEISLETNEFTVNLGVNKFELDLQNQVYLKHKKMYSIVITNAENRRSYSMSITYINPDFIK